MRVLEAADVSRSDLARIEAAARELPRSEFADALLALFAAVRDGEDYILAERNESLSPATVATMLGMSRPHLYKLLDAGDIPFTRVGRDRRIMLHDVVRYKNHRDVESKALAERFAHSGSSHDAAVDAIEELLD
jgi:excisionase family DNA binding protein